ncbi:MAG: hypothetical protein ACOC2F_08345 [Bacteroidota bacterium]
MSVCCLNVAYGFYDENYGKPLLALYETNPWLPVVGSDAEPERKMKNSINPILWMR